MLVVRATKPTDLEPLMELAAQVGTGMTTLKPDRQMLSTRLAVACASFDEKIPREQRDYVFVMEDTTSGRLAGVCAIKAAVGLDEPFYNYRIGTLVHSSRELNVFSRMETLYLSNDLTGSTELCSLFLHPDYRQGTNGKLLSKSRLLFIAQFPQLFGEKLIAEMRGFQTSDGASPFYEGLGRHFFQMGFSHVDDLTSLGKKSFIAELMPRQPLYVAYLPEDAQQAIGKVHVNTEPARHMLEQEGLHFEGYIDIFDAGPVVQARIGALRAVRESSLMNIKFATQIPTENDLTEADTESLLVSNTILENFRVIAVASSRVQQQHQQPLQQQFLPNADSEICLSHEEQQNLTTQVGDSARVLSLNPVRSARE